MTHIRRVFIFACVVTFSTYGMQENTNQPQEISHTPDQLLLSEYGQRSLNTIWNNYNPEGKIVKKPKHFKKKEVVSISKKKRVQIQKHFNNLNALQEDLKEYFDKNKDARKNSQN